MQIIENLKFKIENLTLFILILLLLPGCVKYSLSGGDTGTAKTITIRNFFNEAGGGPPNLTQVFSEKLRDYYQQNTKLEILGDNGDWQLEGRIISYVVSPIAPSGTGTAAMNRLTIAVSVEFFNTIDAPNEVKSFEEIFTFYDDYPQTQSLSTVEADLIETILNRIVFDIFSKTTSNW